ncbi:phage head closure protein [Levilactobacillus humaensis]|uniref:phage head closure protein n=1 Tax=Levilactobacillus humaensis TaxID=2950375 RepID=UPI0021C35588|nr:phage head closure protein [Levilactobacillus humaensis]
MAELTNELKWVAQLLALKDSLDEYDRSVQTWPVVRSLRYEEIGITSTEQFQAKQAKTDVVLRILIRYDKRITQKASRVMIDGTPYKIVRIYTERNKNRMELSLAYVN